MLIDSTESSSCIVCGNFNTMCCIFWPAFSCCTQQSLGIKPLISIWVRAPKTYYLSNLTLFSCEKCEKIKFLPVFWVCITQRHIKMYNILLHRHTVTFPFDINNHTDLDKTSSRRISKDNQESTVKYKEKEKPVSCSGFLNHLWYFNLNYNNKFEY